MPRPSEKIAAAAYLISSLVKDDGQLSMSLRKTALDLIDQILDIDHLGEGVGIDKIKKATEKISSLLFILVMMNLLPEETFKLMKNQIGLLVSKVRDVNTSLVTKSFGSEFDEMMDMNRSGGNTDEKQKYISGRELIKDVKKTGRLIESKKKISLGDAEKSQKSHSYSHINTIGERKELIISILKNGGDMTISDFKSEITDCSEKTIQRELSALIAMGIVKKEGERRWTKYSLI